MYQSWENLLFLHWEVDPASIQTTLPPGLQVDVYQGRAYLGIVPFFMKRIRPRFLPSVPYLSNFLECNVRTYVHDAQGTPGVWFYSLDTNRWLAHWIARRFFHLPYFWAAMRASGSAEIAYELRRRSVLETSRFTYAAPSDGHSAERESLDFFLLERYLLYSYHQRKEKLYRGRVFHAPYQISQAQIKRWDALPIEWNKLPGTAEPPIHACFSRRVDVEIFRLESVPLHCGSSSMARSGSTDA